MKAGVASETGVVVADIPVPRPKANEVLVNVKAVALNPLDWKIFEGQMAFITGSRFPRGVGIEFAGEVVSCGPRVLMWRPGDRVMGIVSGGAYAEKLVIHERQAMEVPAGMTWADAAAIPEVFITAWDALVVQGGLTSGRWAMVHAGASGVGTAAIQICRAIGARVIVTCSAGKVQACRGLGADVVVDYGSQDFVEAAREATGGAGVDVVLDVIGGEYVEKNVAALAVKGRIIQVGVMAGKPLPFNVGLLLGKRATITGTVLRARPTEEKIAISRRFAAEMLPLFSTGALRPVVDSVYAFADVAEAQQRMASNANTGKIVLDLDR